MPIVIVAMLLALLVVVLTILASRGILTVNGLIGIRTPTTKMSERAWEAGHKAAMPTVIVTAAVTVAGGGLVLVGAVPGTTEFVGTALVAILVIGLIGAAIVAERGARKAL